MPLPKALMLSSGETYKTTWKQLKKPAWLTSVSDEIVTVHRKEFW